MLDWCGYTAPIEDSKECSPKELVFGSIIVKEGFTLLIVRVEPGLIFSKAGSCPDVGVFVVGSTSFSKACGPPVPVGVTAAELQEALQGVPHTITHSSS